MPSEKNVNTKIAELKQQETDSQNNKASAKKKLQDLGLTVDEIKGGIWDLMAIDKILAASIQDFADTFAFTGTVQ